MAAAPRSEKVMVPPMADPSSENKVENPDFSKFFLKYHGNNGDDVKFLFNINLKNLRLLSGDKFQLEEVLDMDMPFPFDGNEHLGILGSAVDGVICLYDVNNQKKIILWNPANDQKRALPTNYAENLGTIYDCIPNIQVHGFGYDRVNRDFKVIQYVINDNVDSDDDVDDDETNSFWQVYSLSTNKWTKLIIPSDRQVPFLQDNPNGFEVYLDGFCYWLGRLEASGKHYLVSFNLTTSNFSISDAPVDVNVKESSLKLVVLNGSVALIITQHDDPMSFSISILGQIGVKEPWTTLFNVASSPSIKNPIAAGKKGVIFFKGNEKDGKVACFDLTTATQEEICFGAKKNIQQIVFYKKSDHILSMKRKNTSRH